MNGVVYFNVVVAVLLGVIGAKVAFAEKFMYIILAIVVVALVFDTVLAIFLVRKVRCKCCHEKAKAQDPHQAEQAFKPERQPRRPILGDYCEVELLDDPVMRQQSSGVICGLQTASENGGKGEKKADGDSPDSYPYSKPSKRRPSPDAKEKTTVETEEMKMAQRNPDSFYFILEADPEAEERAIDVTFINPRNPIDIASVDKANESSDNPEAKGKGEAIKAQNAGWQKKRGKPKQARGQIARSGDLRRHSTNVYENVQLTSFNETDADIPLRKSQRIATRLQPQVFGSLPDLADLPSNGKVNVSPKGHADHTDKVAPRSACVERQNGGNKRGPGLAKQHVVNETDEDPVMIDNLVYQSADETAPRSNGNLRLHNNRGQRALSGGVYELAKAVDGEDVSITQDVYRNVKQPRPAGRKGNGGARKQRGGDATYANTSSLLLAL
nr:hypothetical protein BaRGS_004171 [Batillaria attramentaria]